MKPLDEGKSRLAGALDRERRERLCTRMLERTLALVSGAYTVVVISHDPKVGALCHRVGPSVRFLFARPPHDLNAALDQARDQVAADDDMLVLPIDLVRLDRTALDAFMDRRDTIGIAPDEAGEGTNLLFLPAEAVPGFQFGFGADSRRRHQAEARRLGYEPRVHLASATALDLDLPADLEKAGLLS